MIFWSRRLSGKWEQASGLKTGWIDRKFLDLGDLVLFLFRKILEDSNTLYYMRNIIPEPIDCFEKTTHMKILVKAKQISMDAMNIYDLDISKEMVELWINLLWKQMALGIQTQGMYFFKS